MSDIIEARPTTMIDSIEPENFKFSNNESDEFNNSDSDLESSTNQSDDSIENRSQDKDNKASLSSDSTLLNANTCSMIKENEMDSSSLILNDKNDHDFDKQTKSLVTSTNSIKSNTSSIASTKSQIHRHQDTPLAVSTSFSSLSVSPSIISKTSLKGEKMSPGLAKRVNPQTTDSAKVTYEIHHTNPRPTKKITETSSSSVKQNSKSNSSSTTCSPGVSSSSNLSSASSSASSTTSNANLKIQHALEKNMQKLNLVNLNHKSKAVNLTKEDIELFTNSMNHQNYLNAYTNESLSSTPEHQVYSHNFDNSHYSNQQLRNNIGKSPQPNNILLPDSTSYYLNRLPNSVISPKQNDQTNKISNLNQVIARNSADREMTPDSIDENFTEKIQTRKKILQHHSQPNSNKKIAQQNLQTQKPKLNKQVINVPNNLPIMKQNSNQSSVASCSSTSSSLSSSTLSSPNTNPQPKQVNQKVTNQRPSNSFYKNAKTSIKKQSISAQTRRYINSRPLAHKQKTAVVNSVNTAKAMPVLQEGLSNDESDYNEEPNQAENCTDEEDCYEQEGEVEGDDYYDYEGQDQDEYYEEYEEGVEQSYQPAVKPGMSKIKLNNVSHKNSKVGKQTKKSISDREYDTDDETNKLLSATNNTATNSTESFKLNDQESNSQVGFEAKSSVNVIY